MTAHAELSSVATRLQELVGRLSEIADGLASEERDDLSSDLFEVERTLRNASRRLSRVLDR